MRNENPGHRRHYGGQIARHYRNRSLLGNCNCAGPRNHCRGQRVAPRSAVQGEPQAQWSPEIASYFSVENRLSPTISSFEPSVTTVAPSAMIFLRYLHPLSLEVGDAAQLEAPGRPSSKGLNGTDNRLLARTAATCLAARAQSAEIVIEALGLACEAHGLGELGLRPSST